MSDLSDEDLMLMFKYGRVDAFDLLFEKYRRPLANYIRQMLGDAAAAEDLFQEVFVQVVRAAGRYQVTAKFSTWLYTIATNRCLNHLGSAGHRFGRRVIPLHDDAVEPASNAAGPEQLAVERELADELRRVVADLPSGQRAAFVLRETHGKPYQEIAEILDQPMGTVKTNLHRARETIRAQMKRHLK